MHMKIIRNIVNYIQILHRNHLLEDINKFILNKF